MAILGPKKGIPSLAAARLQRWAVLLSGYSYEIAYKPTAAHGNADGLSRLPLSDQRGTPRETVETVFNLCQISALPVTAQQVASATRTDPALSKVLHYTEHGWPQQVPETLKPFKNRRHELTVEGGCLLWGIQVIVPKKFQSRVLEELHRDHPGVTRMKALARSYLWWPGLDQDLVSLATSCRSCQAVKASPAVAPLHPWVWPTKPWQRVHIDFAGPFLGKHFLIVVDAHSKWPEVVEMATVSTEKTVAVLRHIFARFGLPEQIVSDNGPQFTSSKFADFLLQNGVKHICSAPYHPSSNGAAERFVQTFKTAMKACKHDDRSLQQRLDNFLLTYRVTPHATSNEAPCALFLQCQVRTRLDLLRPAVDAQVANKQADQVTHHDRHAKARSFAVGEQVMVKTFRPGPGWIPGTVLQKTGPLSYVVEVQDNLQWKRHVDHLKALGQDSTGAVADTTTREGPLAREEQEVVFPGSFQEPSEESSGSAPSTSGSNSAPDTTERRYPTRDRRPPDRFT